MFRCRCSCVCRYTCVHAHVEARGWYQMSSSVAFYFIYWGGVFHHTQFANSANPANQLALGIQPPPVALCDYTRLCWRITPKFCGIWTLAHIVYQQQGLYSLSHFRCPLPQRPFFMWILGVQEDIQTILLSFSELYRIHLATKVSRTSRQQSFKKKIKRRHSERPSVRCLEKFPGDWRSGHARREARCSNLPGSCPAWCCGQANENMQWWILIGPPTKH